jgi:hypothetical protein
MRVLVDEGMPVQVLPPLRLNKQHEFDHIDELKWAQGIRGIARVISSVIVAMPYVLADLDASDGQRIVELSLLSAVRRHQIHDPQRNATRFPYWR